MEVSIPEITSDEVLLTAKFNVDEVITFIQFLADCYKNDSFIITNKFVSMHCYIDYPTMSVPLDTLMSVRANVDREKQILKLQIVFEAIIVYGQVGLQTPTLPLALA